MSEPQPQPQPQPEPQPAAAKPSRTRRRIIVVLVGLLLAGLAGGIYYYDHYLPYWHWRTVEDGKFYRSSWLPPDDLDEAIDKFGLKTVINLRAVRERKMGDWYEKQKQVTGAKGVRLLDIPLEAGTPPTPEQVAEILAVLDDERNLPAMAHCYHGSIRASAAEGLYRREYLGESGAEANEKVTTWGHNLSVKYPEIYEFIRDYVPRRDRADDGTKQE